MPIYEYKCSECGHVFEKIQGFSAPSSGKCPLCNGKASRLLSQCTFHLKGSGWYATDYAKDQDTSGMKYNKKTKKVEPKKEKSTK